VYHALTNHLLNGELYPRFLEPTQLAPPIIFKVVDPKETILTTEYRLLPVPVNHSRPTVGYQVTASNDSSVFYTSDTGPGLTECWQQVSPQLLIIEVTAPNRYQEFAKESGHLTPELLQAELVNFQQVRCYLPRVLVVHMNPWLKQEIESEIAVVAQTLGNPIDLAWEGIKIHL
jgi:cAMP phosphodiesterase